MKKILLIGDSIRKGYDAYVRESMAGLARGILSRRKLHVYHQYLRFLHVWADNLKLYDADAVHFNAGLWDTLRIYGDDVLVKPDTYADNLKRIVSRIRFCSRTAKFFLQPQRRFVKMGILPISSPAPMTMCAGTIRLQGIFFPERTLFSTTYTPLRRSSRKAIIRIKRIFTPESPPKSSAARCATRYATHCGWIKVS